MKFKKLIAMAAAAVMAVGTMSISAFAADNEYTYTLENGITLTLSKPFKEETRNVDFGVMNEEGVYVDVETKAVTVLTVDPDTVLEAAKNPDGSEAWVFGYIFTDQGDLTEFSECYTTMALSCDWFTGETAEKFFAGRAVPENMMCLNDNFNYPTEFLELGEVDSSSAQPETPTEPETPVEPEIPVNNTVVPDEVNSVITASNGPVGSENGTGWFYKNGWFYRDADGQLKTGWLQNGGVWYYLQNDGKMKTGWMNQGGVWYYFAHNGEMLDNGWNWIGGKCYYFDASGAMAANTVIDGYTVDASGAWVK